MTLRPVMGHVVADRYAAEVVAPPYDALTDEQRRDLAARTPDNFLNVLPDDRADAASLVANRATLRRLTEAARFVAMAAPALGVLRLQSRAGDTVAVVGDVEVEAYADGRVLPHEQIRDRRVADLARHLEVVEVASSPVCVTHRPSEAVTAATRRILRSVAPDVAFDAADGVRVSLHLVTDPAAQRELSDAVTSAGQLFVADGHHRAAAVAVAGRARVLTAAVPSDQLRVLAFHRRIDGLTHRGAAGQGASDVLMLLETAGLMPEPLSGPAAPDVAGRVHLTVDGRWWALDLRDRRVDGPVEGLDVRLMEREVLGPLGALGPPGVGGSDLAVTPVPAPMGLAALVRPDSIGLALHPPSIEDVLAVAEAGAVMPAKSTYLEPKLRSGVIVVPR